MTEPQVPLADEPDTANPTRYVEGLPCWCVSADEPHAGWIHSPRCNATLRDSLEPEPTIPDVLPCAIQIQGSLAPGVLLLGVTYRVAEVREHWPAGVAEDPANATVITFVPVRSDG